MARGFWLNLWRTIQAQLMIVDDDVQESEDNSFTGAIEKARQEWLSARSYFDNVTDPDLIDHAIYCVEAAERKYMYLLKQAKKEGEMREQEYGHHSKTLRI